MRNMNKLGTVFSSGVLVNKIWKRFINLQEYQCKKLMSDHGINVQRFVLVRNPSEVDTAKNNFRVDCYML